MKIVFVSILAVVVHQAFAGPRIVGGQDARVAQFPYAAAITAVSTGYTHFCGGVLISNQYVLSAAQCLDPGIAFTIQLGSNHLNGTDPNRITVATSLKFVHPNYDPRTLENDVGLLKTHQPITLSDYVNVVRLPDSDVADGAAVTIVGWGQVDDETPGLSNALRYTQLTSIPNSECALTYGAQVTDNMICLAGNFNEGSCLDDTGSPAVTTLLTRHWLVAISSFYSGNGCESTDPSGYTRVHPFIDWIKGTALINY